VLAGLEPGFSSTKGYHADVSHVIELFLNAERRPIVEIADFLNVTQSEMVGDAFPVS
jgi:hypothetical protein